MPIMIGERTLSWVPKEQIEEQALKQVQNLASMPFIFDHVALMPDCHFGLGATVGSCIPTERAIIPAAVGVDIGCFTGDTKIPLLDGTQRTLRDLKEADQEILVYSIDLETNKVVPGKARALKTRSDAALIRVTVSGEDEIRCTPDHQFLLVDGSYKPASELTVNQRLMPFYGLSTTREGYQTVTNKVPSIEALDAKEDVYCLQVEEYHNFALAAGIFVHNCGMIAVRTPFTRADLPEDLSDIRKIIEEEIPLSAGRYNQVVQDTALPRIQQLESLASKTQRIDTYNRLDRNWRLQVGTLGSGNHFIELTLDEQGRLWTFLHSGSRGIGNKIAQFHIGVAKKLAKQWFIPLPDPDLAYLVQDTQEFKDYITDLQWAQEMALHNRAEMTQRVLDVLAEGLGRFREQERIECHHNFTRWESHHGKNILVSRKGAIEAREGQMGLIPGSMGTRSYVVRGKGNPASFNTAPHGAGRRMSRTQARKQFTMDDFDQAMEGIEVNRSQAFLDELPGAYKDIDLVMEQSKDLVDIVHEFRQILNVKGD